MFHLLVLGGNKVSIVIPIHEPKYLFVPDLLKSYETYHIYRSADLHFIVLAPDAHTFETNVTVPTITNPRASKHVKILTYNGTTPLTNPVFMKKWWAVHHLVDRYTYNDNDRYIIE